MSDLDGQNGFVINGEAEDDSLGKSVSTAGDVNGDGIDDVIIGTFRNNDYGRSYVLFGNDSGFPNTFDLSSLNGVNGFVIHGVEVDDLFGSSVSTAGDVNGDGIDDVIIGAHQADPNGDKDAGRSYLLFGSDSGFPNPLVISSLDGSNGIVINGVAQLDSSGFSVSTAGDVNGDGIDDVIIGAFVADPNGIDAAGTSYVVFGSDTGFPNPLNLSNLNGLNGFVINGMNEDEWSGFSVSDAGDVNGDGVDDVIIGAQWAWPNGILRAGRSYVVFGSDSSFPTSLELSSLDGSNGFIINGEEQFDHSGRSVSTAGDVNGDGINDVIIGAIEANSNGISNTGSSYVLFGSNTGFSNPLELSSLDGSNGFVINGVAQSDESGRSVSIAGDVNNDGIDDLMIGASNTDTNGGSSGSTYIVFGSDSGFPNPLDLSTLEGLNGFVINGLEIDDFLGNSVSNAGDVNGDGADDVIIGAVGADPNGNNNAGNSYVVFGKEDLIFYNSFE